MCAYCQNDQHCTTLIGFSDPRFRPEWKPRWIPGMAICTGKSIHKPFFWFPFWFSESVTTNLFARVNGWLGRDSFATWNTSGLTEQSYCQFWLKIDPPKILLDPLPTLPWSPRGDRGWVYTWKCHSPWVSVLHWGLGVWHSVCDLSNLVCDSHRYGLEHDCLPSVTLYHCDDAL